MKSYIDRNMKECKSVATPKSRDSGRWWMFAVFMILDMKDAGGLLKRKWWEALTVECGWTVLSTPEWNSRFPFATVCNMIATSSDHGPILLQWQQGGRYKKKGKKMFRYEIMWESHEDFFSWMANAW